MVPCRTLLAFTAIKSLLDAFAWIIKDLRNFQGTDIQPNNSTNVFENTLF